MTGEADYFKKVSKFLSESTHYYQILADKDISISSEMSVLAQGGFYDVVERVEDDENGEIIYHDRVVPEEKKIDFLVLNYRYVVLDPYAIHCSYSDEICGSITATEFKKKKLSSVVPKFNDQISDVVLTTGQTVTLYEKPVRFKAKTNRDNQYGETTWFYIVGEITGEIVGRTLEIPEFHYPD